MTAFSVEADIEYMPDGTVVEDQSVRPDTIRPRALAEAKKDYQVGHLNVGGLTDAEFDILFPKPRTGPLVDVHPLITAAGHVKDWLGSKFHPSGLI